MSEVSGDLELGSGDKLNYTIISDKSILHLKNEYSSFRKIKEIIDKSTLYPRFRIYVLNPDETIRYQIPNEDIVSGGTYNENYQNGSRRTFSFSLYNEDGRYSPSINTLWIGTKIRLDIGLEVEDGSTTVWFQKGVFVINSQNPSRSSSEKTISIDCSDKFSIFEGKWGTIPTSMEIPVGTKIKDVLMDILKYDKGNDEVLDYQEPIYHYSFEGRETQTTISLSAGSTWSSLIMQLAEILSAEVFYDSYGRLNVLPIVLTMYDGDKPVLYEYDADKANIQNESISFSMDEYVNCIYVVGANINGHTCIAKAENNDPASPLCVERIGRRVGDIINDENITSDSLAQERADYELRNQLITKTTMSAGVFLNPILAVNNIVTFTDDFFSLQRDRFLIQSISIPIGYDGIMSLSVSNINNLPFIVS